MDVLQKSLTACGKGIGAACGDSKETGTTALELQDTIQKAKYPSGTLDLPSVVTQWLLLTRTH